MPAGAGVEIGEADRKASSAPLSRLALEPARAPRPAAGAKASVAQVPDAKLVPVAPNQLGAALVAGRGIAFAIMDVAGVGVAHPVALGDLPGPSECRGWRVRSVQHLEVRVKSGEMERHVRTQVLHDPTGHLVDLLLGVVLAGDDQVGDLEPDVGFLLQVNQGVQNRPQVPRTYPVVETLGEGLEVHVGRVHVAVELGSRLVADLARGNRDGRDSPFAASLGHVDRVLVEDHRIVVRERDAAAAELGGRARDRLGRGAVGQRVDLTGLADVPVLTETAAEIAPGRTEREHGRAG